MALTYSIVTPGQNAVTYTQISDILALLPDNTQKLINPKDVRDAVFSNWENSVFRYTTNSQSSEYIGLGRSEIKDVRFFFGKKELSGSSILSNSVLSGLSDVDIFFYNTKSDSAITQDLKIAFLAGSNTTLHTSSPYLLVSEVVGSTPSLSLTIAHNQTFGGDFNFLAGSNGRISINNLIFPSVNEFTSMVSSPTYSVSGDLMLVRSSSGYLELRNPGTSSELSILKFTESTPTLTDFGGVPAGTTFSEVPLEDVIRQILYPYLGPLTTISLSSAAYERNDIALSTTPVNFTYTLNKRSGNIISSLIKIQGNSVVTYSGPTVSGSGYIINTVNDVYGFSGSQISSNATGIFTFSVSATDGTQSYTSSAAAHFVYPYFYGFAPTSTSAQNNINNYLTKLVDVYDNQTISLAGSGYLYFCYPNSYGLLSEIYDGNNFLLWQSGSASTTWTYSVVSISSPSGYWNTSYKIFRTLNTVTIPPPSQGYKFNFS